MATTNHDIKPWMKVLMLEIDQILKRDSRDVTTSVRKDLTTFIDYITNGDKNGND
tara:strand:+ start:558 stop:722 length:165 start_codon:yes stop_codon:yes gene_type:complete